MNDLNGDEVQTLLVMIDVCQRNNDCSKCGNKSFCDSAFKKLSDYNNRRKKAYVR